MIITKVPCSGTLGFRRIPCCTAGFVVEPAFSPATVNQTSFKITNQWIVDGSVYAQPLYAPQVHVQSCLVLFDSPGRTCMLSFSSWQRIHYVQCFISKLLRRRCVGVTSSFVIWGCQHSNSNSHHKGGRSHEGAFLSVSGNSFRGLVLQQQILRVRVACVSAGEGIQVCDKEPGHHRDRVQLSIRF